MYHSRWLYLYCLFVFTANSCLRTVQAKEWIIASNGDRNSVLAADYLYQQLKTRQRGEGSINYDRNDTHADQSSDNHIYVEVVPNERPYYEVQKDGRNIRLFTSDIRLMRWLSYQLIDYLAGQGHPLAVTDLPPAYITFRSEKKEIAFAYREPYLRPNLTEGTTTLLGTHNVDIDWGLWGHQLPKIINSESSDAIYALVDGKRVKTQYCYSSEKLYSAIYNYIIDEHGDGLGTTNRFMIAPQDNALSCTCDACLAKGNSSTHATPALSALASRLSKAFPSHQFYLLAYLATERPPTRGNFPANLSVVLSTINLPKGITLAKEDKRVRTFVELLQSWKSEGTEVYLWDYVNNFDDYFTPYPNLYSVQQQLIFFKQHEVKGLFLNGSGYDYSSFDDLKTYLISALLINPELSIRDLTKRYLNRFYPKTADLIYGYYMGLEEATFDSDTELPLYGSFRQTLANGFEATPFIEFYEKLLAKTASLDPDEGLRIGELITALSYTRLQLFYHAGWQTDGFVRFNNQGEVEYNQGLQQPLSYLGDSKDNQALNQYKEAGGSIKEYLANWETIINASYPINSLRNKDLKLSNVEAEYSVAILNDGVLGFDSDFHQGWYISNSDIDATIPLSDANLRAVRKLRVRFLTNERHRMYKPQQIKVELDGRVIQTIKGDQLLKKHNIYTFEIELDLSTAENLMLYIQKNKSFHNSTLAIDEIQLLN